MESWSPQDALHALAWQIELGADEALADKPTSRYDNAPSNRSDGPVATGPAQAHSDPVREAEQAAAQANDIEALRAALRNFSHCELKRGSSNLVFADGLSGASVMVIGDPPDRDEDRAGLPFAGQSGALFDKMFAAIGLERGQSKDGIYVTKLLPWCPPQGQAPHADDIAMLMPFLRRHIELAQPRIIVLMGHICCQALIRKSSLTQIRGQWFDVLDRPAIPIYPPSYLRQNPIAKREAWADLLALKSKLDESASNHGSRSAK